MKVQDNSSLVAICMVIHLFHVDSYKCPVPYQPGMLCLDHSYFSQETGMNRWVAVQCVPWESLKHSAHYTSQKCSDPCDCEPHLAACFGGSSRASVAN